MRHHLRVVAIGVGLCAIALAGSEARSSAIPAARTNVEARGGAPSPNSVQHASWPLSRAERTDYRETSRYGDVVAFLDALARLSDRVQVTDFGTTVEGRRLPLVILADPPIYQPVQAWASDKLVVFVMANIHAGEVEGKEACLHLMRAIALGGLRSLLDDLIILMAPIYNADGNERISPRHRPQQKGPVGGVGIRFNAQGLDLNRDYMKLESPEARALVRHVFNSWDPALVVDLHTTDGSHHGYALTYAPPLNPNTHPALIDYLRDEMLPTITGVMDERHHFKTYYYGNFIDPNDPSKGWRTFDHRPRLGNNYVGLRNRLTILSEAYAYKDFRTRIEATERFVQSILEYSAAHADEMRALVRRVDRETITRGRSPQPSDQWGIRFRIKPLPHPVEILTPRVIAETDPTTGRTIYRRTDEIVAIRTLDYGLFEATETIQVPFAYALPPDQRPIVDKVLAHGLIVEEIREPLSADVEEFIIRRVTHDQRPFQGHRQTHVAGSFQRGRVELPAGSFLIPMAQPKARLAFYLLEARSDDGLVNWNAFDTYFATHARTDGTIVYPVYRLMRPVRVATRLVHPESVHDER
ncbi:MAG: peptidase M14 [Acidobacteria bacterium]|nr:MAG: peptidase M14 [Acidobacteriota bacterium]